MKNIKKCKEVDTYCMEANECRDGCEIIESKYGFISFDYSTVPDNESIVYINHILPTETK